MPRSKTTLALTLALAAAAGGLAVMAEARRRDAQRERTAAESRREALEVEAARLRAERDAARAAEDRARIDAELARSEQAAAVEACRCADVEAEEARQLRAEAERTLALLTRLMGVHDEAPGSEPRERWTGVFLVGIQGALEAGEVNDALFFIERSRADVLLDQLRPADMSARPPLPEALRRAERLSREREAAAVRAFEQAAAGGEREATREARAALQEAREERLQATLQTLRLVQALAGEGPASPPTVEALKEILSPHEAYVAYAVLPEEAVAVVVTRQGGRLVRLCPLAALEDALAGLDLAPSGTGAPTTDLGPAVIAARKALLDPLGLSASITTLIVSPEEPLLSVPFCLLVGERDVAFVPSASVYRVLRASLPVRGEGVLAVGDPDRRTTGRRPLPPLPNTRAEAQAIGTTVLVGPEATERRFKEVLAARHRWRAVHLGCHGDLEPDSPFHDALILGGEGEEDGFLSALDIAQLSLASDLVSLGSCETGLGPVPQGRGIGALTRAFLFAGASRVLASQTKIDDEATTALLIRFYALWNPADGSPALPAAAALRAAQQHVRTFESEVPDEQASKAAGRPVVRKVRRWEHPFYWAPWILWGPP